MTRKNIITMLKKYQKKSNAERLDYFNDFEKTMIYRTTKTENPQTTKKMVEKVLNEVNV